MAQVTSGVQERKEQTETVAPFGIEADHPRNGDLLWQCLRGLRLRSRISGSRIAENTANGTTSIPPDQAQYLGQFPEIPGMQLHVHPAKLSWKVLDPLAKDEEKCERIAAVMNRIGPFHFGRLKGVPPQEGTLDVHMLKTLVREMFRFVTAGEAKVIQGVLPDLEQIDRMPGRYVLDPAQTVPSARPRFEDQLEDWVEGLNRQGM